MRYVDELDGSWRSLCADCGKIIYRLGFWQEWCQCGAYLPYDEAPLSVVIGSRGQPLLLPPRPAQNGNSQA